MAVRVKKYQKIRQHECSAKALCLLGLVTEKVLLKGIELLERMSAVDDLGIHFQIFDIGHRLILLDFWRK